MVGGLILLKEILQILPSLGEQLEGAESQLLQAVGANCSHEVFKRILEKSVQLLDEVGELIFCPPYVIKNCEPVPGSLHVL